MRIMIFGKPGSGKSTFSVELQKLLNIDIFHLDKYFYESNWKERNYNQFLSIQENFVNKDQWIIDGNCLSSLEMRFQKATHCLYFCISKYTCYYRVLKRFIINSNNFDDRAKGCHETIRYSLLKYIWNFEKKSELKIIFLQKKYPKVKFFKITSSKNPNTVMDNLELIR